MDKIKGECSYFKFHKAHFWAKSAFLNHKEYYKAIFVVNKRAIKHNYPHAY